MITLYDQNIWNRSPAGYRNTLVRALVREFDADICTFQECGPQTNRADSPDIVSLMQDVYAEATPEYQSFNYTPVFYKKEKFTVLDKGYLLYDGLNDANSKSVTWAVLEEKDSGEKYAVASTHFWWMARGEEDSNQRIENARQLQALCEEIIEKYHLPVIIGGDFNNGKDSEQGDAPYWAMLAMGFRDIRTLAKTATAEVYTCREAYPVLKEDGTYGKCEVWPHECIDYIFVYGDDPLTVSKFDIITSDAALTASDHCPLIGCFEK